MHLHFRNINTAFKGILERLLQISLPIYHGPMHPMLPTDERNTRNGKVVQITEPLIITYYHPWERVLFNPVRRCNPFFHFAESLWMLCGQDDVATPAHYANRIREYSDDGKTLWGAYGYRWRTHFGTDQILRAISILQKNPETRRVVIGMWDPEIDLGIQEDWDTVELACYREAKFTGPPKDLPCNTHIYLSLTPSMGSIPGVTSTSSTNLPFPPDAPELEMTVCNRSNDLMWGMLGANIFHFTFLQEYIANCLNASVGRFHQITNNAHLYTEIWSHEKLSEMLEYEHSNGIDPYIKTTQDNKGAITQILPSDKMPYGSPWYPSSMLGTSSQDDFISEASNLLRNPNTAPSLSSPDFIRDTAYPILKAWEHHKARNYGAAYDVLSTCKRWDYQQACRQWLLQTAAIRNEMDHLRIQ